MNSTGYGSSCNKSVGSSSGTPWLSKVSARVGSKRNVRLQVAYFSIQANVAAHAPSSKLKPESNAYLMEENNEKNDSPACASRAVHTGARAMLYSKSFWAAEGGSLLDMTSIFRHGIVCFRTKRLHHRYLAESFEPRTQSHQYGGPLIRMTLEPGLCLSSGTAAPARQPPPQVWSCAGRHVPTR